MSSISNNYINLDMSIPRLQNIRCVKGDIDSRIINITVTDRGQVYNLSNVDIYFKMKKPDGKNIFWKNGTDSKIVISNNKVVITLDTNCTAVAGVCKSELQIVDNVSKTVISTMLFNVIVENSAISDEEIESTDDYQALNELILEVGNIDTNAKEYRDETKAMRDEVAINTEIVENTVTEVNEKYLAAKSYAENAKTSETNAKTSETNASTSASKAKTSETNASTSASSASQNAINADESATNASQSEINAARSEANASESETNSKTSETNAKKSETNAKTSETNAKASETKAKEYMDDVHNYKLESQSWAIGGTNSRSGEDTDNSKYYSTQSATSANEARKYYEQSKTISESLSGALRPMGTCTFSELPNLSSASAGDMYNVSDEFTTTSDFKEGSGLTIPAGSNVYKTSDSKWDVLAGSPVTGVKGDTETNYRRGNVNITPTDIGLGNVGNFKAVSTVASQGLTDTEKSNARSNIGAGTSSFSGSYNDLTNKPTFGTASSKDVASSGNASTSQVVMGNDTRLTDSRNASDVYAWAKASTKPTYTASEIGAMSSTNPVGTGSFSMGRKSDTTVGYRSHAEGEDVTASGSDTHAEGCYTKATGDYSHTEGYDTTASGNYSHAEGAFSVASGTYSHAGGNYTIAKGEAQTTIGKYNVEDTTSAFIVGNGASSTERSNALSVDWNGNLKTAGDITNGNGVSLDTLNSNLYYKIFNNTVGTNELLLPSSFNELLIILEVSIYQCYSFTIPKAMMANRTTYWRAGTKTAEIILQVNAMSVNVHSAVIDGVEYKDSTTIALYYK